MTFYSCIRRLAYLTSVFALCAMHSGCAQFGRGNPERSFAAHELPRHLHTRRRINPQELNLASFASVPVHANAIGPGDFLEVNVAAGLSRDQILDPIHVQVSDEGTIWIHGVGTVDVRGMRPEVASTALRNDLIENDIYLDPLVTIRVKQKRTNTIRVMGGVNKGGVFEIPASQSDLFTAIAQAGGLSAEAGDKIDVRGALGQAGFEHQLQADTGNGTIQQAGYSQPAIAGSAISMSPVTISLSALAQNQNGATIPGGGQGYKLADGAVVHVQKRDPIPITVQGLVNKPGPIPYTGNDVKLWDAIAQAGGVSNQFSHRVRVIRPARQGAPINIIADLNRAKHDDSHNLLLAPGDVVYIEQTTATLTLDALRIIRFGVTSRLNQLL